jgi:hypothetical protein
VNGIPLTVVRTYNSLNPDSGDFGYSWTYTINDVECPPLAGFEVPGDMELEIDEERGWNEDVTGELFSQEGALRRQFGSNMNKTPRKISAPTIRMKAAYRVSRFRNESDLSDLLTGDVREKCA